jgi:hypothetical protein
MPSVQGKTYRWSDGVECFVYAPAAPFTPQGQQYQVLCFLHGRGEAVAAGNPDGVAAHGSPAWHAQTGSALTAPFLVACISRVFPAPAGMNRRTRADDAANSWVPRARGNEPASLQGVRWRVPDPFSPFVLEPGLPGRGPAPADVSPARCHALTWRMPVYTLSATY